MDEGNRLEVGREGGPWRAHSRAALRVTVQGSQVASYLRSPARSRARSALYAKNHIRGDSLRGYDVRRDLPSGDVYEGSALRRRFDPGAQIRPPQLKKLEVCCSMIVVCGWI